VIGARDEEMLDRPAPVLDRALAIRRLVGIEHFVDRGVAYRMCRHAPAEAVEFQHHRAVLAAWHYLDALDLAAAAVGLGVRLAHVAALEAAVDQRLHA